MGPESRSVSEISESAGTGVGFSFLVVRASAFPSVTVSCSFILVFVRVVYGTVVVVAALMLLVTGNECL